MAGRARPALLCITPAPAIDRTARVERIVHDTVLRPLELHALPGGKGVNAARAAVALGGRVITTGIAGGHAGRWLVETLSAEGLEPHWSFAKAEARTTYVIVDDTGESILLYERPARATPDEFSSFLRLLEERLLPASAMAVVAGSIPAGLEPSGHGAIVEVCRSVGVPLLVDASGQGLVAALAAGPDIVKIGLDEAVEAGVIAAGASAGDAADALVETGRPPRGRDRWGRRCRGRERDHELATDRAQGGGGEPGGLGRLLQRGHVAGADGGR